MDERLKKILWLSGSLILLIISAYLILKPTVINHMVINPGVVERATAEMETVDAETLQENQARIHTEQFGADDAPVEDSGGVVENTTNGPTDQAVTTGGSAQAAEAPYEMAVNADGYSYPVSHDENISYDASNVNGVGEIPQDAALNYDYMVGEVYMPAVDMHVPILEGISNENLWLGAGTMKPGQVMGERNYALAGHHMWDEAQLFTPIMNSSKGDSVYVTDKNTVHGYAVTEMFVAQESDGYLVDDREADNGAILTMVTCTDVWGTERYIVVAELVDSYSVNDASAPLQELF